MIFSLATFPTANPVPSLSGATARDKPLIPILVVGPTGLAYDAHLRAEIEHDYKTPSTTAAHAILTAATALGLKTVSIV